MDRSAVTDHEIDLLSGYPECVDRGEHGITIYHPDDDLRGDNSVWVSVDPVNGKVVSFGVGDKAVIFEDDNEKHHDAINWLSELIRLVTD